MNISVAAKQLELVADLLCIEGIHPLRSQSYRHAAHVVAEMLAKNLDTKTMEEQLSNTPGIGSELAAKITTLLDSGHLPLLDELSKDFPIELTALLKLPGLGPRRVKLLYTRLGIDRTEKLEEAAQAGLLRNLPGFGPGIEKKLLNAIKNRKKWDVRQGDDWPITG